MDQYFLKHRMLSKPIPGLVKTDRAILYLKQSLSLILTEVGKRTTKTIGDTYYRIARLRHELIPVLRMSGERIILEKIIEFTNSFSQRTNRDIAITYLKNFQNFLENYHDETENDDEVEILRDRLEQLEQQIDEKKTGIDLLESHKVDDANSVFVIMPFNKEFNDVWKGAIEMASKNENFTPIRVDMINKSSNITDDIIDSIKKCKIAIVDVSSNNPNVMFELGYAVALNKPNIIISQSVEFLPFDIRNIRSILYVNSWSGIEELRGKIQEFLKEFSPRRHSHSVTKGRAKKK